MIEIMNLRKDKPMYLYDVKVCRGSSPLGNPFPLYEEADRDKVCNAYERWFVGQMASNMTVRKEANRLLELYRKHGALRLFCWCAPKRCHAQTIRAWILDQEALRTSKDYL